MVAFSRSAPDNSLVRRSTSQNSRQPVQLYELRFPSRAQLILQATCLRSLLSTLHLKPRHSLNSSQASLNSVILELIRFLYNTIPYLDPFPLILSAVLLDTRIKLGWSIPSAHTVHQAVIERTIALDLSAN